jgi:membrane protein
MRTRLRSILAGGVELLLAAARLLSRHRGTQMAASMSYYALFSIFPAALVVAAAAGFFFGDTAARQDAVDFLLRELPLDEGQGRADLETVFDGIARNAGTLGLIGVAALLVTASALISATRHSVGAIFGDIERRGFLRGKGLDLLLILALGVLFAASFAGTLIGRLDPDLGGPVGEVVRTALTATGSWLVPMTLTAIVFGALLMVLSTGRPPLRDIWPGVLFATGAYELLKHGFSLYLASFADYGAVYGPLGAVIAFMFFVFLASLVFLLGAAIAAVWPDARDGRLGPPAGEEDERSLGERTRDAVGSLFRRNPVS